MDKQFYSLLESRVSTGKQKEQEIQDFMEQYTEFLPIPDLLGHGLHFNIVISKLPISDRYQVDYAYLTKNSDSWRIVLAELESPKKSIFRSNKKSVQQSAVLTASLAQIQSWKEFLARERGQVLRRLRPLLQPLVNNPVHFHYVLVIGRSTEKDNYTGRRARIDTLIRETGVRIQTHDTILRAYKSGFCYPKHVLRIDGDGFRFRTIADCDTALFAFVGPEHLHLTDQDKEHWTARGYDIDSWKKGDFLIINNRYPKRMSDKIIKKVLSRRRK